MPIEIFESSILNSFYVTDHHFNLLETKITCADKLWAISHMVNNEEILDYSLEAGANALEMDLTFDESGNPKNLYHNWFCDCLCSPDTETCMFDICEKARPVGGVLKYFMSHEKSGQVAMLYMDNKLDDVPEKLVKQAAANLVDLLEKNVLAGGYRGVILMAGANKDFLKSLADEANKSSFKRQLFVGHDHHFDFKEGMELLADLNYPYKIASTGMPRCAKWAVGYGDEIALGRVNKARGVISDTIIWTLDKHSEYDKYYNYGARGIITNNIKNLLRWAKGRGYQLYTTEDAICGAAAGRENLVTDVGHCGCEKEGAGCRINDEVASVQGSACKCSKQWFFSCKGDVVGCKNITSPQCLKPDQSEQSCIQGGGDCRGY